MRIIYSLCLFFNIAWGRNNFSPKGLTAIWDTTSAAGILNGSAPWSSTSTTWTYENGTFNSPFCQGCNVSFGSAGSTGNGGAVSVSGVQLINSMTFDPVEGGSYTLNGGELSCSNTTACTYTANVSATIECNISGSKNLIKNGNYNLTVSADNSFTGTIDINAGTLTFSTPSYNHYRGGQININGAATMSLMATKSPYRYDFPAMTFNFNNVGGGSIITTGVLGLNWVLMGDWTFATNGGARNTLGGTYKINMNGFSGRITFSVISGLDPISDLDITIPLENSSRGIYKTGSGVVRLMANNTNTGEMHVLAGTLSLGDGVFTGNIIPSGNLITNDAILNYNTPSTISHSGVIAGTGSFVKQGTGTLTLSGNNTYTGATLISGGTLSLGNGTKTLNIIPAANLITTSATLIYDTPSIISHSGVIAGTGSFVKQGTGTLTLTGANTFSGGIQLKGGTIKAGNVNGFGSGTVVCSSPCTTGTCTVHRGGFATPNTITTNGLCSIVN